MCLAVGQETKTYREKHLGLAALMQAQSAIIPDQLLFGAKLLRLQADRFN